MTSRRPAWLVPALACTLATLSLACARRPDPSTATPPEPRATPQPEPIASAPSCPPCGVTPCEPPTPPPAEPTLDPAAHDMARVLREANTPPELTERGAAAHVWDDHAIDDTINPFYLRGDFDGDGRADYLVSVVRKDAKPAKDGSATPPDPRLVVLRAKAGKDAAVWLTEDEQLSLPARDGWYVHGRHTRVPVGFDGTEPPRLVGDAFVMMKAESSSALVYWTGKRFASHWLSD